MLRHCTIDELLELRDGGGTDACRAHVAQCEACGAELERLYQRRAALKALSGMTPPRDRWPVVRDAVMAQRRRTRRWWTAGAGVVAAAVVALVVGVNAVSPVASGDPQAALDSLVQRSNELDQTLRVVSAERRVMDGLTALTIAELEDRVAAVDSALARGGTLPRDEMQTLWHERVNLMQALVTSHVRRVSYVGF